MMSWVDVVLWGAIAALVLCPPKWDPAIRWKEYNEAWRKRLERRK